MTFRKFSNFILPIIICLALIGLADSVYLTYSHYSQNEFICSTLNTCNIVTESDYSKIFGIYVSNYGVIFYGLVFILSLVYSFVPKKIKIIMLVFYLSPIGFLASLWFVYIQLFVLKAVCNWCMLSAISSTLIFIISIYFLIKPIELYDSKTLPS